MSLSYFHPIPAYACEIAPYFAASGIPGFLSLAASFQLEFHKSSSSLSSHVEQAESYSYMRADRPLYIVGGGRAQPKQNILHYARLF